MSYKVLFVATQSPGVTHYRMGMFNRYLKGEFWPPTCMIALPNWEDVLDKTTSIMYDLEKAVARSDRVVFQRVSTLRGLALFLGLKDKHKKKMFTEIDDDAFHVDSSNPASRVLYPGSEAEKAFRLQLENSDGVIVSTEALKRVYLPFNKKVSVIRNCVDKHDWPEKKKDKVIRIFWQGAAGHVSDLELLLPVVPKVLKSRPGVEFHFMGTMPDYFKIKGCFFHPAVTIQQYPKEVAKISPDIILAPLQDTHLNRGRSNLRVLEAGALSVPVVASSFKKLPYFPILTESEGGILAKTTNEWVAALLALIDHEDLRLSMGKKLAKEVQEKYNAQKVAEEYKKVLFG